MPCPLQEEINAHLNLLLDPSTERTPRLTRPLHDVGLSKDVASAMAARKFGGVGEGAGGEGAETILPRPRRNSFVDLFRDEEQLLMLGGKDPKTPKISALVRKLPVLLRANFVLTKDRKRPYYGHFCGKMHREGSCSKAAGGP